MHKQTRTTNQEQQLEIARQSLNFEATDGPVSYSIHVRRRNSSSSLSVEDLVFEIKFTENGAQNLSLFRTLEPIYRALHGFVERLQNFYPDTEEHEQYVFLAITSRAFTSNIYSGTNFQTFFLKKLSKLCFNFRITSSARRGANC